jgi:hypothetical protein
MEENLMEDKKRFDAFFEGSKSFYKGELDNPYQVESIYAKEWQHGQDVAFLQLQEYWNKVKGFSNEKLC